VATNTVAAPELRGSSIQFVPQYPLLHLYIYMLRLRFLRQHGCLKTMQGAGFGESFYARLGATVLLVVLSPICHSAIYKCAAKDGSTIFSDQPCAADANTVSVNPQQAPLAGTTPDAKSDTTQVPLSANMESIATQCESQNYTAWLRNQDPKPNALVAADKQKAIADQCHKILRALEARRQQNQPGPPPPAPPSPTVPPTHALTPPTPLTVAQKSVPTPQGGPTTSVVSVLGVKQAIDPTSMKTTTAVVATSDGGFFVAGGYRKDDLGKGDLTRQWYLKISSTPSISWETAALSDWVNPRASSVYSYSKGGYWALGGRFAKDPEAENKKTVLKSGDWVKAYIANKYDVVLPLDKNGASLPTIAASEVGKSNNVSCGAETPDGFVFVGWRSGSPPETWHDAIPLIEKVDKAGKLTWLRDFPQDATQYIDVSDQIGQRTCTAPIVDADGSITFGLNLRVLPITHSSDEWVKAVSSPATNHKGLLVVRLDANGKELARVRHDNATDGFLLTDAHGFLLVERKVPQFPVPGSMPLPQEMAEINRISATGYGARFTNFDGNLQHVMSTAEYKTGALETIKAVHRTADGGILLAGCPVLGGNNYVVYINSNGVVSPALQISPMQGLQQCSLFEFNSGTRPGEALAFLSNDIVGARVITLKY
jgi:hypothetical protein